MNDHVKIQGESISQFIVDLLNGEKGKKNIEHEFLVVAKVFQHPHELPYLIEKIYPLRESENDEKLRFALLRVQIYCDMNMNRDLEQFQKLNYISETIENVLFGGLLKEGADIDDEDEEEEDEEEAPPKKSSASKETKSSKKKAKGKKK